MRELLLAVLTLLRRHEMADDELAIALAQASGLGHGLPRGRVAVALDALQSEGLAEAVVAARSVIWRLTPAGSEALRSHRDEAVFASVGPEPQPAWPSRRRAAERAQVTIMFTDVVGSTALLDRAGEAEAHRILRRHLALMRRVLGEHDGHEVKSLGDGLMVAFSQPAAAVECAIAMQRAAGDTDDPLELRIGIASGEVVNEDDDYFGRPVIVAKRLCDAARPGAVVVSESPADEPASHDLVPLGPLELKGLSEPVTASALQVRPLAMSA